jgi:hypothetical protein
MRLLKSASQLLSCDFRPIYEKWQKRKNFHFVLLWKKNDVYHSANVVGRLFGETSGVALVLCQVQRSF